MVESTQGLRIGTRIVFNTGDDLLSQNIPFRHAAFVVLFLAVVQFILQMSLLAKGVEYVAASLTIDDTYYYLQTAWNTKQFGFVTFDGLHSTNGVQLLWFVIIYLLAMLVKTKTVLLFTTLAVSFLLNGLCYLIILRIAGILKQPWLALFMASFWALQSLPFRVYAMGMENSLHAFIFWCVIWQSTVFLIRVQNREKPNFLSLTVVLILNAWTRLDSALLSAVLFVFSVGMLAYTYRHNLRLFFQQHGKDIAGSSFLAGLGLIAQLTAFRIMGDSFLPVSALIKTSSVGQRSAESIDKLVGVLISGMPSIMQDRFPALILVLLGLSGILLVILARVALRDHSPEMRAFLSLWSCFLVGEMLYHAYIGLSGAQYKPYYFFWYRSPSFIFWITTGSMLALFAFAQIRLLKLPFSILKWVQVGFSLIIYAVALYMFVKNISFTSSLFTTRYNAALWIAENFPPDTIFASWNTGQLGFFSDRTFINLDGLINNVDYYERVLRGSVPLSDYLAENKVDYIVDYSIYQPIPDYPVVHMFPISDESGRSIHIWQVSPQLSSVP